MTKAKAILLTSLVMVTGCSFIPRYQRPAAPVPPAYPGAGPTNAASATIRWNQFFTEARQQQLIALALTNNRDLRAAALRVDQSQAQYRISRSALFPRQDVAAGFARTRSAGVTRDQWSANIGSTAYEVDLFGRVRSLNRQALEKYLATAEARRATHITLVAEVATADLDLRRATQQLALATETLRLVEESRALNKAAFDNGASNERDVRSAARVAVIGSKAAHELFGPIHPVGMNVRVRNIPFVIIGLLESKGAGVGGQNQDDRLIIPYTTAMRRLTGDRYLRSINLQVRDAAAIESVQQQVTLLLRQRHRLPPDQEDDFNIFNQKDVAATVDSVTSVIKLLLGFYPARRAAALDPIEALRYE